MKYPKYNRKQDLRCKLLEEDIKKISSLRKRSCFSLIRIAEKMKVSTASIHYWLLSNEERKERNKKQYLRYDRFKSKIKRRQRQNKSLKRKRKIMTDEFRRYGREVKKKTKVDNNKKK